MNQPYQKKSYKLFVLWLILLFVVLLAVSYFEVGLDSIGAGKAVGITLCLLLDFLFVLIFFTESIYWINGVTYEEAEQAEPEARKRYAFRHLKVFLVATAVYLFYCFVLSPCFSLGIISDSLMAGAVICIAALFTIKIHL